MTRIVLEGRVHDVADKYKYISNLSGLLRLHVSLPELIYSTDTLKASHFQYNNGIKHLLDDNKYLCKAHSKNTCIIRIADIAKKLVNYYGVDYYVSADAKYMAMDFYSRENILEVGVLGKIYTYKDRPEFVYSSKVWQVEDFKYGILATYSSVATVSLGTANYAGSLMYIGDE